MSVFYGRRSASQHVRHCTVSLPSAASVYNCPPPILQHEAADVINNISSTIIVAAAYPIIGDDEEAAVVLEASRAGAEPPDPMDTEGNHNDNDAEHIVLPPLTYPGLAVGQPIYIRPYQTESKDDDESTLGAYTTGDYTSDGDIISVTESILYRDQDSQGPLLKHGGLESATTAAAPPPKDPLVRQLALTGTVSVRSGAAAASAQQPPSFQYDASRLDQVISNAKGNQKI
jgi:hypothetical protein